jgi:hypothetical protein
MAKAVGISVSSVQRIWKAHGLKPRDFFFQERDALAQLRHREQAQILPDLMGDLLLGPVVVVDPWHRRSPAFRAPSDHNQACRGSKGLRGGFADNAAAIASTERAAKTCNGSR